MGRFGRIVLIGTVIVAIVLLAAPYAQRFFFAATTPRAVEPRGRLADFEQTSIALFERASPSVVQVVVPASANSAPTQPRE